MSHRDSALSKIDVKRLATSQVIAVLRRKGVTLPEGEQPRSYYVGLCRSHGVAEVSASELKAATEAEAQWRARTAHASQPASSRKDAARAAAAADPARQRAEQAAQAQIVKAALAAGDWPDAPPERSKGNVPDWADKRADRWGTPRTPKGGASSKGRVVSRGSTCVRE